jgi:hypothetical protein
MTWPTAFECFALVVLARPILSVPETPSRDPYLHDPSSVQAPPRDGLALLKAVIRACVPLFQRTRRPP